MQPQPRCAPQPTAASAPGVAGPAASTQVTPEAEAASTEAETQRLPRWLQEGRKQRPAAWPAPTQWLC